jgi:hypothetical protein
MKLPLPTPHSQGTLPTAGHRGPPPRLQHAELSDSFRYFPGEGFLDHIVVLVLLLQHPVLVLVFKQKLFLVSPGGWRGLNSFFSLSFSISHLVSSSLSEVWLVLKFWRSVMWSSSHPALELGFLFVGLLGACFFALTPFSGARS